MTGPTSWAPGQYDWLKIWRDMYDRERAQGEAATHPDMQRSSDQYAHIAARYAANVKRTPQPDAFMRWLAPLLRPGMTVLDIGAGSGRYVAPLWQRAVEWSHSSILLRCVVRSMWYGPDCLAQMSPWWMRAGRQRQFPPARWCLQRMCSMQCAKSSRFCVQWTHRLPNAVSCCWARVTPPPRCSPCGRLSMDRHACHCLLPTNASQHWHNWG